MHRCSLMLFTACSIFSMLSFADPAFRNDIRSCYDRYAPETPLPEPDRNVVVMLENSSKMLPELKEQAADGVLKYLNRGDRVVVANFDPSGSEFAPDIPFAGNIEPLGEERNLRYCNYGQVLHTVYRVQGLLAETPEYNGELPQQRDIRRGVAKSLENVAPQFVGNNVVVVVVPYGESLSEKNSICEGFEMSGLVYQCDERNIDNSDLLDFAYVLRSH